jgi:transaldolase
LDAPHFVKFVFPKGGSMELYLDTGNIQEIQEIARWGILAGVTTNPSLLAKERGDYQSILKEICSIVKGPVSAEVTALDSDTMVTEARELYRISEHIVVKIPCTAAGITATKSLSLEKIPVNMTLIFSPIQALVAARAGARFTSPFVGRLDDIGEEGIKTVEAIVRIYKNYGFSTKIIFASVRHPNHVLEAALIGADIATIPYTVFRQMIQHPLTDIGLEKFLADWHKRQQ